MSDIKVVRRPRRCSVRSRRSRRAPRPGSCSATTPDVIAARVDGELQGPRPRARRRRRGRGRRDRQRRRPRHPAALDRARDGAGGAGALPRRQARHRPADRETASTTTSTSRPRSCPRTSRRSRPGCARSSRRASGSRAGSITDDDARDELADEPYKLELIGLKGGPAPTTPPRAPSVEVGAGELTIYDNLDRDGEVAWKDLCRGPHLPTTKRIPAFKLMRSRGGVLARRREEQAAAAHLRHRLGDQGGARGAPAPASRRPSAATTASSARELDLFSFPDEIGSGLRGLPPQGRRDQAGDGGLRPPAAHRGGLRVRRHPAHLQGGAVPHLRAPAVLRRHACSRRWRWRARTTTSRR